MDDAPHATTVVAQPARMLIVLRPFTAWWPGGGGPGRRNKCTDRSVCSWCGWHRATSRERTRMTLFLYETVPSADQQNDPSALIDAIARSLTDSGAEVIETQITK